MLYYLAFFEKISGKEMSFFYKFIVVVFASSLLFTNDCSAFVRVPKSKKVQSCSQASQDQFVYLLLYEVLKKSDSGYYLEIGAGHPITMNNSYFFEKTFQWKGISIDISNDHNQMWHSIRKNPLLVEDAMQSDYSAILKKFPQVVDYLSLDVDTCYDLVLKRIPFDEHVFKIITIEHDFYRYGDLYRNEERRILISLGYHLLCPDVTIFYNGMDSIFEDWWIHPSAFPANVFTMLSSLDLNGKNHGQIISTIRNCWTAHKRQLLTH